MNITVNLELIATQDYKRQLIQDLYTMHTNVECLELIHDAKPTAQSKEELKNALVVLKEELHHCRQLFQGQLNETIGK